MVGDIFPLPLLICVTPARAYQNVNVRPARTVFIFPIVTKFFASAPGVFVYLLCSTVFGYMHREARQKQS